MALTPPSEFPAGLPGARFSAVPAKAGLYNPAREKDACGLAMVATLRGTAGHDIIDAALNLAEELNIARIEFLRSVIRGAGQTLSKE